MLEIRRPVLNSEVEDPSQVQCTLESEISKFKIGPRISNFLLSLNNKKDLIYKIISKFNP